MTLAFRGLAGAVFTFAILATAFSGYVALVYHGDVDAGAEWVVEIAFGTWIAIFAIALAACFLALILLFVLPERQAQPGAPQPAMSTLEDVRLTCTNCQQDYIITDTGERPLMHICPHCGFQGVLEGEPSPMPAAAPTDATVAQAGPGSIVERSVGGETKRFMVLRCGNCRTNFETEYSDARPLVTVCTNCGRRGILKDSGAPVAA